MERSVSCAPNVTPVPRAGISLPSSPKSTSSTSLAMLALLHRHGVVERDGGGTADRTLAFRTKAHQNQKPLSAASPGMPLTPPLPAPVSCFSAGATAPERSSPTDLASTTLGFEDDDALEQELRQLIQRPPSSPGLFENPGPYVAERLLTPTLQSSVFGAPPSSPQKGFGAGNRGGKRQGRTRSEWNPSLSDPAAGSATASRDDTEVVCGTATLFVCIRPGVRKPDLHPAPAAAATPTMPRQRRPQHERGTPAPDSSSDGMKWSPYSEAAAAVSTGKLSSATQSWTSAWSSPGSGTDRVGGIGKHQSRKRTHRFVAEPSARRPIPHGPARPIDAAAANSAMESAGGGSAVSACNVALRACHTCPQDKPHRRRSTGPRFAVAIASLSGSSCPLNPHRKPRRRPRQHVVAPGALDCVIFALF